MGVHHKEIYRSWCTKNDFNSMLPDDRAAEKAKEAGPVQSTLDSHIVKAEKLPDRPPPYTNQNFEKAVAAWIAATDQVSCHRFFFLGQYVDPFAAAEGHRARHI